MELIHTQTEDYIEELPLVDSAVYSVMVLVPEKLDDGHVLAQTLSQLPLVDSPFDQQ